MKKRPSHPANALIHESSPYLLQHAYNPVNWLPWGDKALDQARQLDKPLLISIGYAACHWCHVMAHHCFEDVEVAKVMNDHFICVKVDREEHPNVDQFFMTAIQLTGTAGGWPLNIIALPNGEPLWGGTYFPKDQWIDILKKIHHLFNTQRSELAEHAQKITLGIRQVSLPMPGEELKEGTLSLLFETVKKLPSTWDTKYGGHLGSPKFPIPVMLHLLLDLQYDHPDSAFEDFIKLSLDKMARGGLYDQVGGGFARYSVDEKWRVPHFEKMLYDNAQLMGLYAQAYSRFKSPLYKQIVYETAEFLRREMTHLSGAVYSSLNADSEGIEGKFYTWGKPELKRLLGSEFELFSEYYQMDTEGYWEEGRYILLCAVPDDVFARKHKIEIHLFQKRVKHWKALLLKHRQQRPHPSCDDKAITSWNALMIEGLCQSYQAFGDNLFRNTALANARFIVNELFNHEGSLFHTWKNGSPSIPAFMDDYAHTISAFLSLYEISGAEEWLTHSVEITKYAIAHFYDAKHQLFRFTEKENTRLPAEYYQTEDQTTPSSNSVMGHNLVKLASFTGLIEYQEMASRLLKNGFPDFLKHPWSHANWGRLGLFMNKPLYQVVITGEDAEENLKEMQRHAHPNVVWALLLKPGSFALTQGRWNASQSTIYVCKQGACQLPVTSVSEAKKLIV